MVETCWTLLQIAPTQDENDIRRAYARRLRDFRPDEDPEGFQRLVGAKEAALNWAKAADLLKLTADDKGDLERNVDLALLTRADDVDQSETNARNDTPRQKTPSDEERAAPAASDSRETENEPAGPAEFTIDAERDSQVFERLDEIVARDNQRPWSAGAAAKETRSWIELFDKAAILSLQRHEQFLEAIGRYFPPILPDAGLQRQEILDEFVQGHGFAAVVETIEQQCRFAGRPAFLAHLCGQDAAMLYFSWLAHAQSARGILQRREVGRAAYTDAHTGLPVFPPEDRVFALQTAELVKFHREAVDNNRWPFRFDWKTLFFPTTQLAAAGLGWQGGLFLAMLGLIVAGATSPSSDIAPIIGLACIPLLVGGRIAMAFFIDRLAVGASLRRVMRADRRGLWSSKPRPEALRNKWHDYAKGIFVCELLCSLVVLLLAPIMISTFLQLKDDLDRPAETVVSEMVVSALDAVANDDRLPDSALFDLIEFVNSSERQNFTDRSKGAPITVRDLRRREWLAELHHRVDRLLGGSLLFSSDRVLLGPILATPAAERERKLRILANAYRSATPERRMEIQRTLAGWKPTLDAVRGPQGIAAVWAAIPPRSDGPNLDAFPEKMRGLLLDRFLGGATGISNADDIRLVTRFHYLLTAPADALAGIGPIGSADVNSLISIDGPNPVAGSDAAQDLGVARYLVEHPDRPTGTEARLRGLVRINAVTARSSFLDIARICLDSNSDADRLRMREVIAQSLENPPAAGISASADLWQTLGRLALAEPSCYRKAFMTGRVSSGDLAIGQLDGQFDAAEEELDRFAKTDGGISNPAVLADFVQFIPQNGVYYFTRVNLISGIHSLLGRWSIQKGDYRDAVLEFDQALLARECNEFYTFRRQALQAIGDHKRAEADLDQVLSNTSSWCMIGGVDVQSLKLSLKALKESGR